MSQEDLSLSNVGLSTEQMVGDVASQISLAQLALTAHAALAIANTHSGLNAGKVDLFDQNSGYFDVTNTTLGKKVGDYAILVKLNGRSYLLPASKNAYGPPKVPQITVQPTNQKSHADGGQAQPSVTFSVTASGTLPMTFSWEVQMTSASVDWQPIIVGQFYGNFPRTDKISFNNPHLAIASSPVDSVTSANPVSTDSAPTHPTGQFISVVSTIVCNSVSHDDGNRDNVVKVRCRINNVTIDGGYALSNSAALRIEDITDCI